MNLTVYLAKPTVDNPLILFKREYRSAVKPIQQGGLLIGDLVVSSTDPRLPRWVDFFRSADNFTPSLFAETSNVSAAFLVMPEDRPFVLTFGHGRSMLNLQHFEDDFGLKVALNAIDQDSVKSIDKQAFDAISKQAREQAAKQVDPKEFGLDVEDDLLRAVVGTPTNRRLGSQLLGREALHATGLDLQLTDLHRWLSRLLQVYQYDSYKDKFPWVDNIRSVRDTATIENLDRELIERLNSSEPGMIWLAVPDIIDWRRICAFTYAETKRKPVLYDMHLNSFKSVWGDTLTLRKLKNRRVGAVDENDWMVDSWPVHKCIHAEVTVGDEEYLLTGGNWYKISLNYVETVNDAVRSIAEYPRPLPPFGHQNESTEPEYNDIVAHSHSDLHGMDSILIGRGHGRNPVEACDLLTKEHDFIHVKRYSGSSDLSHLFAQGYVSGDLLATDDYFRHEFNRAVPKEFRIDFARHLQRDLCGVVFAIVSRSPRPLVPPFFSRVTLKNASRRLESMGFRVYLKKIEVTTELRKLKRYVQNPKLKKRG